MYLKILQENIIEAWRLLVRGTETDTDNSRDNITFESPSMQYTL